MATPNVPGEPPAGNPSIPCTFVFPGALTLDAQLSVREEAGDVAVHMALAGKPPFSTLVLSTDAVIDLNLRMIGAAVLFL